MSWFKTIGSLIKGKSEDAKKSVRNSQMDTILDQNIRDQKAQVAKIKKSIAGVMTQVNLQKKQKDKLEQEVKDWTAKAKTAAKSSREDLVAKCISEKREAETQLATVKTTLEGYEKQLKVLEKNLERVEKTVSENERQASVLKARKHTADALGEANKALSGINNGGAFDSFNEFEEEINRREAEADAFGDLATSDELELEEELASLKTTDVDDETAALMDKYADKAKTK